jgi:hypothetical protein
MDIVLINSFSYAHNSNGITSLNSIASIFRRFGHAIYGIPILSGVPGQQTLLHPFYRDLYPTDQWEGFYNANIPSMERLGFKLWDVPSRGSRSQIVIYPEVFLTKIFPDSNTVWYVGHKPGALKNGHLPAIDANTFVIAHSKILYPNPSAVLFFPLQDRVFSDVNYVPPPSARVRSATYTGKGHLFGGIGIVTGTELITRTVPASKTELKAMLLSSRFVFTFDSWTNVIVEAILCGAVPVILRFDPFTKSEVSQSELGPLPVLEFSDVVLRDGQWHFREPHLEAWFELERLHFLTRLAARIDSYESDLESVYRAVMSHFDST